MKSADYNSLAQYLWGPITQQSEQRVYLLLDAARDACIYPYLAGSDTSYASLYRGDAAVQLTRAAPYLVELQLQSPLSRWVLEEGWGNSWGVFIHSSATLAELQVHFRRFLRVQEDTLGKTYYFRFYDPRVLRAYLPTCSPVELQAIFGPVQRFIMEAAASQTDCLEWSLSDERLIQKTLPLLL